MKAIVNFKVVERPIPLQLKQTPSTVQSEIIEIISELKETKANVEYLEKRLTKI